MISNLELNQALKDDAFIIESRFRPVIWDSLKINCPISGYDRCVLFCEKPCPLANSFIEAMIKLTFKEYCRCN